LTDGVIDIDGHTSWVVTHYFSNISHVMQIHDLLTVFTIIEALSLVASHKGRLHEGN
jgi:hypothetical protein